VPAPGLRANPVALVPRVALAPRTAVLLLPKKRDPVEACPFAVVPRAP
jgi:hypothetical protein